MVKIGRALSNRGTKRTATQNHKNEASDDEEKDPDGGVSDEGEEEMLDDQEIPEDEQGTNELWVNPTALFEVELQQSQVICLS